MCHFDVFFFDSLPVVETMVDKSHDVVYNPPSAWPNSVALSCGGRWPKTQLPLVKMLSVASFFEAQFQLEIRHDTRAIQL